MRAKTLVLILLMTALAVGPAAGDEETAAIAAVIEKSYVGGIWMEGDEEAARSGFDPAFVMQVNRGAEGVLSASLDGWLERLGLHGEPLQEGITHRVEVLDQTGSAAVAKVEVHQDGEPLYTDYMSLYKLADGWKIVAKTFYSH